MRNVQKFPNGKILGTVTMWLAKTQEVKDLTVSRIGGRYRFVERSFREGKQLAMRQTDDYHSTEDAQEFVQSWIAAKEHQLFVVQANTVDFNMEE